MTKYFHGGSWEECAGLPDDASLLVRSLGTENVHDTEDGIRTYARETGKGVPYIMAVERKDDVKFYVPKDAAEDLRNFLKAHLGDGKR